MNNETICAIATPHGRGGISIVRLSGEAAHSIALRIVRKDNLTPRYAHLYTLYDDENDIIDEAIVIYFQNPRSFTGEDVVEFQLHGGTVTAQRIMDTCLKYGARLANPGEFTKRAVLSGKMDLSQAEAVAKLIESKSVDAAKILSKQLKGELQKYVDTLRDQLVEVLAFIEVNIDYAEEDLPQTLQLQIAEKLQTIKSEISKTVETSESREGLIEGFKVAIIGKPNVGKSSLLNALLRYDRAIISDIAGTTRDTIEEEVKIGTHLVKIVDTAGIRESSDSIEKIGIERSIAAIDNADIVIALFDGSQRLDENDYQIIKLLKRYHEEKEMVVAVNKSDLAQNIDIDQLQQFEPLSISAKKGAGKIIEALRILLDSKNLEDEFMLISRRQINAAKETQSAIDRSFAFLETGELELFAYEINSAIEAISSITAAFERDEILDKMFGSFCLGK
jgi:tRNA modification GTPase